MKNKNRIYRAAALLLVLCFISTVMISGTFAKYTSEYSGSDTALVAKWDLDVKGGGVAFDDAEKSLDLFSHAYDENIVLNAGTDKIIAPGVEGRFVLSVTNNSDVAAGVTFDFEATGFNVPMEYKVGTDDNWGNLANLKARLSNDNEYVLELDPADGVTGSPVTIDVDWRWPFEHEVSVNPSYTDGNEEDTDLGKESAKGRVVGNDGGRAGYVLTVTAKATQLKPEIETSTTTTP